MERSNTSDDQQGNQCGENNPGITVAPSRDLHNSISEDTMTESKESATSARRSNPSFIREVLENKDTRIKFVLINAIVVLGYNDGQLRPAFPDLIEIANVNLEKGSSILTSYYSGRLMGAGLGGILLSKVNKYIVCSVSLVLESGVVAAIPWCTVYELMVGIHALQEILQSILNVDVVIAFDLLFNDICFIFHLEAIATAFIQIWGTDSRGRTYIFSLYAFLEISCAIAPIGTAPFLHENEIKEIANISATTFQTGTCCSGDETFVNDTRSPSGYPQTDSRLYIAYSISAGMAIAVAVPFLIVYLKTSFEDSTGSQSFKTSTFLDKTSQVSNYLQFINIGLFTGIYTVMEMCYPQYLTVFYLQYLDWTKTSAAMATSVLSFSRLGGKFVGIVLVRVMKAHTILLLVSLLDTFGFVCLNISAYTFVDVGVWASACITGLGTSIMWPTALSWINSNLIAVSGKVSSYLLVIAYLFALMTPIALGYLMQEVSLLWFCYISLIASVAIVANIICMVIHTKRHDRGGNIYKAEIYTIESANKKEAQSEVTRL